MNAQIDLLASCMDRAERGLPGALKEFYLQLLKTEVFLPTAIGSSADDPVREATSDSLNFLNVGDEKKQVIPIFSNKELAAEWSEQTVIGETKQFSSLLWTLPADSWLHLNPGGEVGKELSPWELALLKDGEEAVDEIVFEMEGPTTLELDVEPLRGMLEKELEALGQIVDVYTDIEEAFMLKVTRKEDETPKLYLGLKAASMPKKKRETFLAEIESFERKLPAEFRIDEVVFDVEDEQDFRAGLFNEMNPFYIRQKSIEGKGIFDVFLNLFKR